MRSLSAFVVMALVTAMPVIGQAQVGSPNRVYHGQDAIIVAENFGYCVSGNYPEFARQVLDRPMGHNEVFELRALPNACVQDMDNWGGEVRNILFPYPTLHAVLALGVLQHEEGPAVELDAAPTISAIPDSSPTDVRWLVMQQLGACLARRFPAESLALARAPLRSSAERDARSRISPLVGACIEAGSSVRLDPVELRWSVALAYYRLRAAMTAAASHSDGAN